MGRRSAPAVTLLAAAIMIVAAMTIAGTPGTEAQRLELGREWAFIDQELDPLSGFTKPEIAARLPKRAGTVTAQTIFPPDERVPIEDTSGAPWRSVVHLVAFDEGANPLWECSGSMINFNVVLTAAHCVTDDFGDYVPAVVVIPGETATSEPFGFAIADTFSVPLGYVEGAGPEYDFALLYLEGDPFEGEIAPYLTVASAPDAYFDDPNMVFASAGYPGDKPFGSMWFTAAEDVYVIDELVYTTMDAYPGQSGSPIWILDPIKLEVFVVAVYSTEGPLANRGVRFSPLHLQALNDYCSLHGCTVPTRDLAVVPLGADATPASTPTPTRTPTPTNTPSPTASPSPSASPTALATATATPTTQPRPFIIRAPFVGHD